MDFQNYWSLLLLTCGMTNRKESSVHLYHENVRNSLLVLWKAYKQQSWIIEWSSVKQYTILSNDGVKHTLFVAAKFSMSPLTSKVWWISWFRNYLQPCILVNSFEIKNSDVIRRQCMPATMKFKCSRVQTFYGILWLLGLHYHWHDTSKVEELIQKFFHKVKYKNTFQTPTSNW